MTDSQHRTDRIWKDAEALVERVEHSARSDVSPRSFFDDLCSGLRLTSGASSVALWTAEGDQQSILCRSGLAVHDGHMAFPEIAADHAAHSRWLDESSTTSSQLVAFENACGGASIGIQLRFDEPVELALRRPLAELSEALLDLAAVVYARWRVSNLERRLEHQSNRDDFVRRLHDGVRLQDSFASIAMAVAEATSVDRVSLLRHDQGRWRMIAASSQATIDRRARQVRLLESLAHDVLEHSERFTWTDEQPLEGRGDVHPSVTSYVAESGCREIHIEAISREPQSGHDAAIVVERFRDATKKDSAIDSILDPVRDVVWRGVRSAIGRDEAAWHFPGGRFRGASSRRKTVLVSVAALAVVLAACLVPATLSIPVEGRIVAAERSRLFAPNEGIIDEVAVRNGQRVSAGETIAVLRSPELDLQQRGVEGALVTARTRLDSLLATRGRDRGASDRDSSASADERVLRTEIAGLERQLQLLEEQKSRLTIQSPIAGRVERWDLRQALASRPVTHGQFLVDVIADGRGWIVELELPEDNIHYVMQQQNDQPCRCTFRLRSNPEVLLEGVVSEIDDVAHINHAGQSVIRATVPLKSMDSMDVRSGATVAAQIHCGKRPIGFIWLRGLVEWTRRQTWF